MGKSVLFLTQNTILALKSMTNIFIFSIEVNVPILNIKLAHNRSSDNILAHEYNCVKNTILSHSSHKFSFEDPKNLDLISHLKETYQFWTKPQLVGAALKISDFYQTQSTFFALKSITNIFIFSSEIDVPILDKIIAVLKKAAFSIFSKYNSSFEKHGKN